MVESRPTINLLSEGPEVVRLRLSGDFDLDATSELNEMLNDALARTGDGGCLIIDLVDVDFMDCAALSVIIRASKEGARRHVELQVSGDHGSVTRLMKATGLRTILGAIWAMASN